MTRKSLDVLFDRYLACQDDLFVSIRDWSAECRRGIDDPATSIDERGLLKNILYSLVRFESQFGQLEDDFWAYWEGYSETDQYRDIARAKGYDSFEEYLLSELGKCHSWLDEISTEIPATGWVWLTADRLASEFWLLMDATEELIEASGAGHSKDEILSLIARIPPQKLAPIQLEVLADHFGLKHANRGTSRINVRTMRVAFRTVQSEAHSTLEELSNTNCDRRFVGYFKKLVNSLDRQFSEIEPVEIGVNMTVVESAVVSIKDEVADSIYGHVIGVVLGIRQFVSNFRDWREYSNTLIDIEISDVMLEEAVAIERALENKLFSDELQDQSR